MVPPAVPLPDSLDDRAVQETDEADEDMNNRVDADVDDRAKKTKDNGLVPGADDWNKLPNFQKSIKCIYCHSSSSQNQ